MQDARPSLGLVVELQLNIDAEKQYSWPAYVTNLRARIRCPVLLMVITSEKGVARWAARPIERGGDSRIVPLVLGPENVPAVTDPVEAQQNVELAVLSARAHAENPDAQLGIRVVATAIMAGVLTASSLEDALRAL